MKNNENKRLFYGPVMNTDHTRLFQRLDTNIISFGNDILTGEENEFHRSADIYYAY